MQTLPTQLLLDGNALAHRAYHGVGRGFIPTHEGKPVGMLFGFCRTVLSLIERYNPEYIICAFDTPEPTFRHIMHPEYKAQRSKAPDDFYPQFKMLDGFLDACNIPIYRAPGFECDDVLGTLAHKGETAGRRSIIVSGDMDFLQCINDKTVLLRAKGNIAAAVEYGPEQCLAYLGISSDCVVDYKALIGDSSDNYGGVQGIGPKGGKTLIAAYGTAMNAWKNREEISGSVGKKLRAVDADHIQHMWDLARISTQAPAELAQEIYTKNNDKIINYLEEFGFNSLVYTVQSMDKKRERRKNNEHKLRSEQEKADQQQSLF